MHKMGVDTYVALLSVYFPICEYDANTAIVLARIIFWKRRGFSIFVDGEPVLVKSSKEMCEETGLKNRFIVKRAYKHLEELGIISTFKKKFNKFPTTHIQLHLEVLFKRYMDAVNAHQRENGLPELAIEPHLLEKPKKKLKFKKPIEKNNQEE